MAALFLGSLMVFGVVLGRIILKEELKLPHIISFLICLAGFSVLVIGPYMEISSQEQESGSPREFNGTFSNGTEIWNSTNMNEPDGKRHLQTTNIKELLIGLSLAVAAGFGEAISLISLKLIQDKIQSVHVLTFWFVLSGILVSVPAMYVLEYDSLSFPTDLENCLYLLGHVVTSPVALLCYIVSMGKLSACLMSILSTSQIPINVLLQYTFFRQLQPMRGGFLEIIGAGVVTIGLIIQPIVKMIRKRTTHAKGNAQEQEEHKTPV